MRMAKCEKAQSVRMSAGSKKNASKSEKKMGKFNLDDERDN